VRARGYVQGELRREGARQCAKLYEPPGTGRVAGPPKSRDRYFSLFFWDEMRLRLKKRFFAAPRRAAPKRISPPDKLAFFRLCGKNMCKKYF